MTPIERFKKTSFAQIVGWTILVASFTSGLMIWIFNNKIDDIKIKCETQSAKYELQITELTIKINRLEGNIELYSENFDTLKVDKFSDWIGKWDTYYENDFHHNLIFRKKKESLLGEYSFKDSKDIESKGFIQVYELTDKYLKGFWTQTKNGKTYRGKLQFILNEDKTGFEGFYSKQAESYKTDYIWNGKR